MYSSSDRVAVLVVSGSASGSIEKLAKNDVSSQTPKPRRRAVLTTEISRAGRSRNFDTNLLMAQPSRA